MPFFFRFPESFFSDLARAGVSLALYSATGILFLRLFIRLPAVLELFAGLFVGIGLSTFLLELFAVFFLLNPFTSWLSLLGLIAFLAVVGKKLGLAEPMRGEPLPLFDGWEKAMYWTAVAILSFISVLTFYHSLFFPVDYWDALILYVHYGKMTYQQGGFPILYCLQVGLGLGANYPHLYPLYQAVTANLTAHWSDLYGQILPPLAGVGSILGVYHLVLWFHRDRLVAILSALAFRSVAFVTSYFIWESDYALVMMYTALYLIFLAWFLRQPDPRRLQPLLCVSAVFPHINYLGWIVWPSTAMAAGWVWITATDRGQSWKPWLISSAGWLFLALTWSIRNWLVTGNPVYAFFPEILGGKNINLDVLASASKEWMAHGGGVGILGDTLWQKLAGSPAYFMLNAGLAWKVAPCFGGIMLPSVLLGWKREQRFYFISLLLCALYFFYEYVVSGLYLYHIIAVFPILAVFVGRFLSEIPNRRILGLYGACLLVAGVVPGISYAMMGSKFSDPSIPLLAHAGMSPIDFYRYRFPEVAPIWKYINDTLEPGAVILSHENRYHVLRDDIRIVHLDDCGLIPRYDAPYAENHRVLWSMGIRYYLYIPDEDTHPITVRLGHRFHLDDPKFYTLLRQNGPVKLYRLTAPEASASPTP